MTHDPRPTTRLAWFSPFRPSRSGVAAYSAELLSRLGGEFIIDPYPEPSAHDFVYRMQRTPYDLVVYQMGNSRAHDYIWGYLVRYPGLVVLHDARLHHARARLLLAQRRFDDYREEFVFNQPQVAVGAAEYAIEGLRGSIYYFWPMRRVIMQTARVVAVHNRWVAGELATQYPDASITTIRMGVPELRPAPDARARLRQSLALHPASVVFAAFGKVTAEKRTETILRALGTLATNGLDVHLLLVGDTSDYPALAVQADALRVRSRVHDVGHVDDAAVADYLAVSDACLCLRWPTAQETSASWLRCLAARRATVISDLAHLADVPADVTLRVDLLDEDDSLLTAMSRLATDSRLRSAIADAGHAYWSEHHALDRMADDYRALLRTAAGCATPSSGTLPRHFTEDYSEPTRRIAERFGVSIDLLD